MLNATAFGIVGTEHQPADAEQADRLRAHRAGLQRHIQIAIRQPRLPTAASGRPQRQQFGVSRGVVSRLNLVAGARQHGAIHGDHHRPNRHLAPRRRGAGFGEGHFHRLHRLVLPRHRPGV